MVNLANKFVEWGYPVDFVVIYDHGPYREMLDKRVDKIVILKSRSLKFRKIKWIYGYARYLRASKALAIMSTIRELNVVVATLGKMFYKGRIIIREAATLKDLMVGKLIKRTLILNLMKLSYPLANIVIANSKATQLDLEKNIKLRANQLKTIYNPMDLIKIEELSNNELDLNFDIVAAGRLDSGKNFKDLVYVVQKLSQINSSIVAVILGEGNERANLEQEINRLGLEKNVKLLGFVDNPYKYFKKAKVFVQTSLYEGFGYVMAEAMACGTPVVAYDAKGPMREILEDGKYGILIPTGDINKMVAAIANVLEKTNENLDLRKAVTRFDENIIIKDYLNAIITGS